MNKKTKKTNITPKNSSKKSVKAETDVILLEDDEETLEAKVETKDELDPEILAVLESKRKKKPTQKEVDYIAEVERGDVDSDAAIAGSF